MGKKPSRGVGMVASLLLAAVACGKGANSPGGGSSKIKVTFENEPERVVDGVALAAVVTSDATKISQFVVYVFASDSAPAPTCALLEPLALASMTEGGFVSFATRKTPTGPGTISIQEMGLLMGGTGKGFSMRGGESKGVSLTLRTYDGKTFAGDIASSSGSKIPASGTVEGAICPPVLQKMPAASGETTWTKQDDDAMGAGEAPALPTAAPPPPPPPPEPTPAGKKKPASKPKPKPKTPPSSP